MEEFKSRRINLAAQLPNNSIAILNSAQTKIRNGDVEFAFRQNSDFYYLTGFREPEAVMVLIKDKESKVKYILFNRANNPDAEIWNGKRAGQYGACKDYAADESFDIATIETVMPTLIENKTAIYTSIGTNKCFEKRIANWLKIVKQKVYKSTGSAPDRIIDLLPLIHEMRLFKSPQEIEFMRKAAEISAAAHLKLMQVCKPGLMEYQLEAVFNEHCLQNGCRGLAYNSIVAGGENACILHYTENDQPLKDGDLVLVDAGGEFNYYAADITRTFPVSGKFSFEQRQIYALVLQAQLAGIEQVRPGNVWDSVQEVMVKIIIDGLLELGILRGEASQLIKENAHRKFYMHGSGHWLGLDVHDAGSYKHSTGKEKEGWRKFEAGMVLTVEPGIYIAHNSGVDQKWLGIGIRIEDDVLVTKSGNEVLSKHAPKSIDEIERARI